MYYFISMYIYIKWVTKNFAARTLLGKQTWDPLVSCLPLIGTGSTWDLLGGRLRWVLRLEIDQQASTNCGVFSFLGGGAVCLRSPEKRKLRRWTGVHKCEGCSCGSWLLPRLLCQRVSNAPLVVDGRASMVLQRTVCPQENVQKSSLCRTWFPGTAIIWNLFNLIHRALKPPQCRDCS